MKLTVTLDTECYPNYWLAMFRNAAGVTRHFEQYDGHPLDRAGLRAALLAYRIVTFNGINYDMPMIALALKGASCELLKTASDTIILGRLRHWQFEKQFDVTIPKVDHIDLIEVAPGVAVSLKLYGGRMHAQRLQDLPIDPDDEIEPEQRATLRTYCGNDLVTTQQLFDSLRPQIELRERMSIEYGQDLRSKSDAQIAEAVIRTKITELTGEKVQRPAVAPGTGFRYTPPSWVEYRTPVLIAMLAHVRAAYFRVNHTGGVDMPTMPTLRIGGGVYRMGIGGLHSSEQAQTLVADDKHLLRDFDVNSYYPAIILNGGLAPKHLGRNFLDVYREIVQRRLKAKRAKDKVTADALKIVANSAFGKLGSMYSPLYSPDLMIQVTLTGQLALLMLIERIEQFNPMLRVMSANTDGIVTLAQDAALLNAIVAEWEQTTGYETEETRYRMLASRDVNNYVAIKTDGEVKTKGVYASAGLMKNPANTICARAVCDWLAHRSPIEETVLRSNDVREFLQVRTVKGGGEIGGRYLGKVVRWYYGLGATGHIAYVSNGNKVPKSDGAVPLMDLPTECPGDIDRARYINEAHEMLKELGC